MAAENLGTKQDCKDCGRRFYDLGKIPPECPKCGGSARTRRLSLKPGKVSKKDRKKAARKAPTRGQGESFDDFYEESPEMLGEPCDDSAEDDEEIAEDEQS